MQGKRTHSVKVRRIRFWRWEDDLLWDRMKVFRTSFYVPASVERNGYVRFGHDVDATSFLRPRRIKTSGKLSYGPKVGFPLNVRGRLAEWEGGQYLVSSSRWYIYITHDRGVGVGLQLIHIFITFVSVQWNCKSVRQNYIGCEWGSCLKTVTKLSLFVAYHYLERLIYWRGAFNFLCREKFKSGNWYAGRYVKINRSKISNGFLLMRLKASGDNNNIISTIDKCIFLNWSLLNRMIHLDVWNLCSVLYLLLSLMYHL